MSKQQMFSQGQEIILVEKEDIKIHIPLSVWLGDCRTLKEFTKKLASDKLLL
jgi:hypothetical protein